jgi:hypothetical protein
MRDDGGEERGGGGGNVIGLTDWLVGKLYASSSPRTSFETGSQRRTPATTM